MASEAKKSGDKPVEPSLGVRLFARAWGTILTAAGIITALVAWVMSDTHAAGRPIPSPLYAYLAVGLALFALCGLVYAFAREGLEESWRRRRALKEGKVLLKEVRKGRRKYAYRIGDEKNAILEAAEKELATALAARDWAKLGAAIDALDARLDEHLAFARKSTAREYAESIGVAVLIALMLRAFVVEAFRIPSGSMIPTLLVGDHIFVNKFIYGIRIPYTDFKIGMNLRKPQRGEVIVFKWPKDPEKDFIKRIIAVEGDTWEVRDNVVYVNGKPVPHVPTDEPREYEDKSDETDHWEHRECLPFKETLNGHTYTVVQDEGGVTRSWAPQKVPPGTVFVMGDNRDNSSDSRYWGYVPDELIKGKAMVIWWSSGQPEGIRVKRMGKLVE